VHINFPVTYLSPYAGRKYSDAGKNTGVKKRDDDDTEKTRNSVS
jgi:hypothetical protein